MIFRFLGIDLGTTNTVMTSVQYTTDRKIVIKVEKFKSRKNRTGEELLPSVVYYKNNSFIIGREAKDEVEQLKSSSTNKLFHVINSKKLMGTEEEFDFVDFTLKPRDVASLILERCGKEFDKIYLNFNGISYKTAPITVTIPARFDNPAKEDTKYAAIKAGYLENVKLLEEPTAALLSYLHHQLEHESYLRSIDISEVKTFLVIDLGGGTCDVVITDVLEDKSSNKSTLCFSNFRNPYRVDLGGADFDSLFARYLLDKFININQIKNLPQEIRSYLKNQLAIKAEEIKEYFSNSIDALVEDVDAYITGKTDPMEIYKQVSDEMIYIPDFYENIDFDMNITLVEYLSVVDILLKKSNKHFLTVEDEKKNKNLEDAIMETLKTNNVSVKDIDYVLFTGGMALFLPLKKRVYELLNKKIVWPDNPLIAVSEGAALFSLFKSEEFIENEKVLSVNEDASLQKTSFDIDIQGTLSCAYLIDIKDELPIVLVEKNTPYPQKRKYIRNKFSLNSPLGVIINIYSGQDKFDPHLKKLIGIKCEFEEGKEKQIGTKFDIWYELDDNGIINIGIEFPLTNETFEWSK